MRQRVRAAGGAGEVKPDGNSSCFAKQGEGSWF